MPRGKVAIPQLLHLATCSQISQFPIFRWYKGERVGDVPRKSEEETVRVHLRDEREEGVTDIE